MCSSSCRKVGAAFICLGCFLSLFLCFVSDKHIKRICLRLWNASRTFTSVQVSFSQLPYSPSISLSISYSSCPRPRIMASANIYPCIQTSPITLPPTPDSPTTMPTPDLQPSLPISRHCSSGGDTPQRTTRASKQSSRYSHLFARTK